MKFIGVILILAGIGGIIEGNFSLSLIFLGFGIFMFWKSYKPKTLNTKIDLNINAKPAYAKPANKVDDKKTITFNVAGVTKKNDQGKDIQKLIRELIEDELASSEPYDGLTNKEILEDYYDERVYEYTDLYGTDEIYFEFEPDNPYDSNAIKVMHEYIDHIGYVPREYNKQVGQIIRNGNYDIEWEIVGGKYKYVDELEDKVKTQKDNYGVKIKLLY